ncbi:hypothetical protein [Haloprofundus salilacus]|uniref:hypothetical protein n=1 Tax=Haloprofundus salilacus TaxID=2876190 RepID=UPI001CCDC0B0|nr:hypothetical protein [Haloprofundus salilacus]
MIYTFRYSNTGFFAGVAHSFTDEARDESSVGGQRLSEGERWLFTFCEREIG